MKRLKNYILFILFFFTALTFAQSGSKKNEKPDYVTQTVEYYKKELELDYFQEAAVRETLESHRDALMSLMQDQNMIMAEKKEKAEKINDKIDAEILKILNPDQTKKYKDLQKKRKK